MHNGNNRGSRNSENRDCESDSSSSVSAVEKARKLCYYRPVIPAGIALSVRMRKYRREYAA
ncbi:MAG TPA: hypothetical protein DCY17_05345 [Clostridiales bacterium]|nr:hypothetical protein [Clostridiales bacterium]